MINQTYITTATTYLVDSTRNLGYMSKEMYETYLKTLNHTGNTYEIDMTHYQYTLEYEEDYSKHYFTTYEDTILEKIFGEQEKYFFRQGDYFMVQVYNRNKTWGTLFAQNIMKINFPTKQVYVRYGGAIRDEVD